MPARLTGALGYDRQISRTGGYRVLLGNAYSFSRRLRFNYEHGPDNNAMPADYAAAPRAPASRSRMPRNAR
jgi:hypothetical protein